MTDLILDIETLPRTATPGLDLTNGPPGWPGPTDRAVERRTRPANITRTETAAEWERNEDSRHLAAVAADVDAQRTEAVEAWRRGALHWSTVRIGCIGWTTDGRANVIDAEAIGERAAISRLLDACGTASMVWTWGPYDAWVIRSVCVRFGIHPGPLVSAGKPWERRHRDLQAGWAAWLTGHERDVRGISVREVAAFAGVEGLVGSGAEVLDCYLGGRWPEVLAHCAGDVVVEWELLRLLRTLGGVE